MTKPTKKRASPIARVMVKHGQKCRARKQGWAFPWSEWLPNLGCISSGARNTPRRRGHSVWSMFGCNCTDCPGQVAINMTRVFERLADSEELPDG